MAYAVLLCTLTLTTLLLAGLGWLYYRTRPGSLRLGARLLRLVDLEVEIRADRE